MKTPTVARALALALGLAAIVSTTACSKGDAAPTDPPAAKPGEPAAKPSEPAAKPSEPAAKPAEPAAAAEPAESLELTLSGDLFGEAKTVTVPLTTSMTSPFMGGQLHQLTAQGPIEVPGQGTVTLDLGLFIPKGKAMAAGTFEGGLVDDPVSGGQRSLVTFALGVGSGETFHKAYAAQSGSFTITDVGPRMRGVVTGTVDVKMKEANSGAELSLKGSFAIKHMM